MKYSVDDVIVIYLFVLVLIQIGTLINYYRKFLYEFTAGNKISWNPKYDRLLLIGSITFLLSSFLLINAIFTEKSYWGVGIYIMFVTVFTVLLIVMFRYGIRQSKKSNEEKLANENKIVEEKSYSFKLNYSQEELKQIYQRLIDNSQIETLVENKEMTDDDYFAHILFSGVLPSKPIFKLRFDNIQTDLFYKHLSFNSENFTMDKFLQILKNKNTKSSPGTISSSVSGKKTGKPKDADLIDSIFVHKKG